MGISGVQADVIGVKEVGNRYQSKIEIIAVEVKPLMTNYRLIEIDQAKRASIYAHKCFLAVPREYKPKEIELAQKAGVGLLELDYKRGKLKLVLPSPEYHPDYSNIIRLLRRLEFWKCALCDCLFSGAYVGVGYQPQHIFSSKNRVKFWKYICYSCAEKIYSLISRPVAKKFAEEWKMRRITNKVAKMSDKIARKSDKWEYIKNRRRIKKLQASIKALENRWRIKYRKGISKLYKEIRKIKRRLRAI